MTAAAAREAAREVAPYESGWAMQLPRGGAAAPAGAAPTAAPRRAPIRCSSARRPSASRLAAPPRRAAAAAAAVDRRGQPAADAAFAVSLRSMLRAGSQR